MPSIIIENLRKEAEGNKVNKEIYYYCNYRNKNLFANIKEESFSINLLDCLFANWYYFIYLIINFCFQLFILS